MLRTGKEKDFVGQRRMPDPWGCITASLLSEPVPQQGPLGSPNSPIERIGRIPKGGADAPVPVAAAAGLCL